MNQPDKIFVTEYHFSKTINISFKDVVEKAIAELQKEGFGIITRIDMKKTLRKKINVNFRKYIILGACNPRYAYEALLEEDKLETRCPGSIGFSIRIQP